MQTNFSLAQLADPDTAVANDILRKCVHCGFCTATCPTYVLLGDENDSPRGRIYLMKEMLEQGKPATAETVKHIDRCLSCLACMTTCPSGVNYMHLVDHARGHIERTYRRPWGERLLRQLLARALPSPLRFRALLLAAKAAGWARFALPPRLRAALDLAPEKLPRPQAFGSPGVYPPTGARKGRVSLLMGCVQSVLSPEINAATIRLLNRLGYEVVVGGGESCCGSITHHMGLADDARRRAAAKIRQYTEEAADAIIITASGCGTTVKDYGHMFRNDPALAAKAAAVSAKAMDITEFLARITLPPGRASGLIAYQAACSLQHGQGLKAQPVQLLRQAGFEVVEPADAHLCCGSAGTYNIMQPELAGQLKARKLAALGALKAQAVASGNVGCITQLGRAAGVPVLHTVQLLDWAYGGDRPDGL